MSRIDTQPSLNDFQILLMMCPDDIELDSMLLKNLALDDTLRPVLLDTCLFIML